MGNGLSSVGSLAYQGTNAPTPPNINTYIRAPTANDYQGFQVGDFWIYRISQTSNNSNLYCLLGKAGNVANWALITGSVGIVELLAGNTGGSVGPNGSKVINVVGDGTTITVAGNPGTNTLTISAIGGGVLTETLTGNSGGAVSPTAGNINVKGDGTTVNIVGNPGTSTLTVSAVGTGIVSSLTGNSGGAVFPTANNTNIVGDGTTISVVGNPGTSTLTISAMGDIATTYDGNTGSATPAAGILNIVGAGGISTSATGSTVTINGVGGGITWNNVTTTSASMAVNNAYLSNNAGLVTVTLPTTAAFGTELRVAGYGAGGWKIAQNVGQNIIFGVLTSTTGVGGSLASTNQYDTVELVCTVANTTWNVLSGVGNITVV